MQELTREELKEIQVQILDFIDQFCKENSLTYFLMFGTLLGAIRHKGFIPWDDDIDVCMPAQDYARFIELMKSNADYRIICADTDPDYYFAFARLSDKKTELRFKTIREIHNMGVFVDVYPINEAPPNDEIYEWKHTYHDLQHKVLMTVPDSAKYQETTLKSYLRQLRKLPERKKYGVENFHKYRDEWLHRIAEYNGSNSYYCAVGGQFHICTFSSFSESTEVEFEGKKYNAPKNYDRVLIELFGNYMILPPENKRKSLHHFTAYWKES